nr:hypothetical protein [uncultured Rhodoferax sp.]
MQFSTTDWIAIYAAVVSTFVLAWDVVKWVSSGARLRAYAKCDVTYPDARVIRTVQTESGESRELADYCHVEVANIGDQPTTILNVEATHKVKKNGSQMTIGGVAVTPHQQKALPYVLPPGEVWSARIEMSGIYALAKRGKPVVLIQTSKARRPLVVIPPPFKERDAFAQ